MLKVKNTQSTVTAIKMITGEEIIALVSEVTDQVIKLKHPLTLVMTLPEAGGDQGQVAFAPWMLGLESGQEITLQISRVVYHGPARSDAATEYKSAIGFDDTLSAVA